MCDYSLMHVKSRAAKVGDQLTSGRIKGDPIQTDSVATKGLFDAREPEVAVCLLPGTEVSFSQAPVTFLGIPVWRSKQATATFRQVNKDSLRVHHDAFEFRSGEVRLVNDLKPGQKVRVLTLPAAPQTAREATEQKRLDVVA